MMELDHYGIEVPKIASPRASSLSARAQMVVDGRPAGVVLGFSSVAIAAILALEIVILVLPIKIYNAEYP